MSDPSGLSAQQIAQAKAMLSEAHPVWIEGFGAVGDLVSKAAWPVITAILLWRLYPALVAIVNSRAFVIKVGSMEISVQEAAVSLSTQIRDLQEQVIRLRDGDAAKPITSHDGGSSVPSAGFVAPRMPDERSGRLLWVDDNMSNNAFEIERLSEEGLQVVQSASTSDAMAILDSSPAFDAVISDMGRREEGVYRSHAGFILLRSMRSAGYDVPFIVYSSKRNAERNNGQVKEAGGAGATSSPVELLEWVRSSIREPGRSKPASRFNNGGV